MEQEREGEQQEREEEQEEEREEVIEARRRQGWRLRFLRPARGRRRLETRWGQLPTVADTPPEARPVVSPGYYYYHYYFFFLSTYSLNLTTTTTITTTITITVNFYLLIF